MNRSDLLNVFLLLPLKHALKEYQDKNTDRTSWNYQPENTETKYRDRRDYNSESHTDEK